MTSISTLKQAEELLAHYIPLAKEITGKDLTLERMTPLMQALGNPHKRLKIVHIAGTSGKTSTSYYIAALLRASGKRVGLTISPHVDSVTERIQIDMHPLSDKDFARLIGQVTELITNAGLEPTYFELLVAAAYWYFAKAGVDYAVIETGLGGLQDATNIADNPDKVCVITDIGMDHMHVLGHTVLEIARQKAGIIHAQNLTLMYRQSDEVTEVFEEQVRSVGANIELFEEPILAAEQAQTLDALPLYQRRNWLLALKTYERLQIRDGLHELTEEQKLVTTQQVVPGRMDTHRYGGKEVIMDGAHNEQKTEALVRSFERRYPGQKVPVLVSLKKGKEFAAVLPLLKPITSHLYLTEFASGQDLPSEAINAVELAAAARKFGFSNITSEKDPEVALHGLLQCDGERVLITGSFYLIGQLRASHQELRT